MLPTLVALLAAATSEIWVSLQPAPGDDPPMRIDWAGAGGPARTDPKGKAR